MVRKIIEPGKDAGTGAVVPPRRTTPGPESAGDPGETARAVAAVAARFRELGLRSSAARDVVVEAFFSEGGHLTLDELTEVVRQRSRAVAFTTVWRTVRLLVRHGFASERDFGPRQTRYEPIHARPHHDHLVCVRCGAVEEFQDPEIERLQVEVARGLGFELEEHRLELYGRCARCRAAAEPTRGR